MDVPLDPVLLSAFGGQPRRTALQRVPPMARKRKGFAPRWKHCRAA